MANKMISEEELHDSFLSALIRSSDPITAPPDFPDSVMKKIGMIQLAPVLKPYKPPLWLKWGIPGTFLLSIIFLLFSEKAQEPIGMQKAVSIFEKTSATISYWLSDFKIDLHLPNLNVSSTTLWILLGGIILTWSFLLLSRILEKTHKNG
jgi:hypothetical protein